MKFTPTCLLAIAALILSSCAGSLPLREARRLGRQDKPMKASQVALRTLKEQPDNRRAQRLSARYLDELILKRLGEAEALRSQQQWFKALERLSEVNDLVAKAKSNELELEHDSALQEAMEQIREEGWAWYQGEGQRARESQSWATAVALFEAGDALRPGREEARTRLAETRRAWAKEELERGEFRNAAGRLARNVEGEMQGSAQDRADSAKLYKSLALSELERGACRQAVSDLQRAEALLPGSGGEELAIAQACGKTALILKAQGQGTDTQRFQEAVAARLQELGSPFIGIYTRPGDAPARLTPSQSQGPATKSGPYLITLTLSPPTFRPQAPQHSIRSVWTGSIPGCLDPYGYPWPGNCSQDVYVTYDEIREDILGEMTVTVAVRQAGPEPRDLGQLHIRAFGEDSARWRAGIRTTTVGNMGYGGTSTVWSGAPRGNPGVLAKEQRIAARDRLTQALAEQLVERVTTTLLGSLDVEAKVPDQLKASTAP